jgi:hypothetical protein
VTHTEARLFQAFGRWERTKAGSIAYVAIPYFRAMGATLAEIMKATDWLAAVGP